MKKYKNLALMLALNLALLSSYSYSTDHVQPGADFEQHTQNHHLNGYAEGLKEKGLEILLAIQEGKTADITETLSIIHSIPQEIKDATALNKLGEYSFSAWFKYLLPNSAVFEERQEHLAKIICLGWALDHLAREQGDSFSRGSFTIVDPEHKIFNFLIDYVRLVTRSAEPQHLPWAMTTNNFAYRRNPELHGSSHHHGQTPEGQFGIDVRFSADQTVYGLLPSMHRHILFGKLDVPGSKLPLTFLKFEPVGLGSSAELAAHSLNFANSGNVSGEARREKDIPDSIMQAFEAIVPNSGLKRLHQMINHPFFNDNPGEHEGFITLLKQTYKTNDSDLLRARTGNEVVLDLRELKGLKEDPQYFA